MINGGKSLKLGLALFNSADFPAAGQPMSQPHTLCAPSDSQNDCYQLSLVFSYASYLSLEDYSLTKLLRFFRVIWLHEFVLNMESD